MQSKISLGARYILGLIFFVFGLNGFLGFIPQPQPTPEGGAFLGALAQTGYFFPILKITEILVGVALLINMFVPLSLVILAPVSIHIFLYHTLLDLSGLPVALAVVILHVFLGYANREAYAKLLTPKPN